MGFRMFQILQKEVEGKDDRTQLQETNALRADLKRAEIEARSEANAKAKAVQAERSRRRFFAKKAKRDAARQRYGGFTPDEKSSLEREMMRMAPRIEWEEECEAAGTTVQSMAEMENALLEKMEACCG